MARLRRDTLVIGYPLICALDMKSFRVCLARALRREKLRSYGNEYVGQASFSPVQFCPYCTIFFAFFSGFGLKKRG